MAKDMSGFTGMGRAHVLRAGRAIMGADTRAPAAAVEKAREARIVADLNMVDGVRLWMLIVGGVGGEVEDGGDDYFRDALTHPQNQLLFFIITVVFIYFAAAMRTPTKEQNQVCIFPQNIYGTRRLLDNNIFRTCKFTLWRWKSNFSGPVWVAKGPISGLMHKQPKKPPGIRAHPPPPPPVPAEYLPSPRNR